MKAVIFAGGNAEDVCVSELSDAEAVICADSGYDSAVAAGLVPDIVIGDMDSVKGSLENKKTAVYPCRKDETDSELALRYALDNGYDELWLFGFTGTRLDHTITNIEMLRSVSKRGARGVMIDAHNEIRYIKDEKIIIHGRRGSLLSVIPINGDLEGVRTKGLEYPLFDETLFFGKSRGVSNVITDDECEITVRRGEGLIILAKD